MACPKGKHHVKGHNRKGGVHVKGHCAKNPRKHRRGKRR
jgi:hypothetical protein